MELKTWISCFLLFAVVYGQSNSYQSYDWRPLERLQEWPRYTSLLPYQQETTTSNYPGFEDNRHYQGNSYPTGYKSQPYRYPDPSGLDHHASFEDYGYSPNAFNITVERYGGFGGRGDTRGYGAYEFPKEANHLPEPDEYEIHPEPPKVKASFPELMRIARNRNRFHNHDPQYIRPLPPPL